MITVIASIKVKPDNVPAFIKIFNDNVPNVLNEDGCIEYYPTVDIESGLTIQETDPTVVTIIECWESIDALKQHLETPHMTTYRDQVKDIVIDVSLKVLQSV